MKKINKTLLSILLFAFIFSSAYSQNTEAEGVERFALYVASNQGGEGRETLKYAGSDAEKLSSTMIELGGVKKQNSFVLVDSTKEEIDGAFKNITAIIDNNSKNSKRVEFLFYYSGHSDEDALLLGSERYDYSELKTKISNIPSDVHIVMLDSCFSGNFIRAKGGSRQASFLIDDSSVVQGHAYLSSSSETEASQESDSIGASYFTQSLVTGLRGAADTSGDNRVSLNELYYYAFNDTLKQTELSTIGTQHPSFDITLVGSGDLVMTDVSSADSLLILSSDISGRFLIRTLEGKLVSEINKVSGMYMTLALPVGFYSITAINESGTTQASVKLEKNSAYTLGSSTLRQVPLTASVARGGTIQPSEDATIVNNGVINNYNVYSNDGTITMNGTGSIAGGDNNIREFTYSGDSSEYDYIGNSRQNQIARFWADDDGDWDDDWDDDDWDDDDWDDDDDFLKKLRISNKDIVYSPFSFAVTSFIMFPPVRNVNVGVSPFTSYFENVKGIQASVAGSMAGNIQGVQASGVFNIANLVQGIQAAGVFNIADEEFRGIQAAGVFNIAGEEFRGIQAAGIVNIGSVVKGVQIARYVNIANEIKGVQLGLVNIADNAEGLQLGLININKNGICDFLFWGKDRKLFAQYRGGTNALYTSYTIGGLSVSESTPHEFVCGAGIGTRIIDLGKFITLDLELNYYQILSKESFALGKEIIDEIAYLEKTMSTNYSRLNELFLDLDQYCYPSLKATFGLNFSKNLGVFASFNADAKLGYAHRIQNEGITFDNLGSYLNTYWTFGVRLF